MTPEITPSPPYVVAHPRGENASEHEVASQLHLARDIAKLLGCDVQEPFRPNPSDSRLSCYYVPHQTLVHASHAQSLGIQSDQQLFGGVVPRDFVATKAITHGLWRTTSAAPECWSHALGRTLNEAVLAGYTVFTADDALQAGMALLALGPVRMKPVYANAGRGQYVLRDAASLRRAIGEAQDIQRGVVLEENLAELATYSVGWCRIGKHELAYVGTQGLTPDNQGEDVYGGSSLRCIPGGPDGLKVLDLSEHERLAVALAIQYDAAVSAAYPSLIASRRNYDVAIGLSENGEERAGVLEQSWRAGGASAAETAALLYFTEHPDAPEVHAYTQERYGVATTASSDHLVYAGRDSRVGLITKTGGIVAETRRDA